MSVRSRRTFLGTAAAAAASGAAGCGGARGNWRFFTVPEARTLEAMLACIIPADDAPGAREAGAIHYIDRQLGLHFKGQRQTYRNGLAAMGNFADEPPERQVQILQEMEKDPARRPFFDLVVTHAMQGFYGSPRHGGNAEFVSWRMLGVSPVPVRGRQ